ncbi:MAG: hypothetical protein IJS94_05265 [Clostridia bacterium]|nr:hypothetical protein [Clostridia bacterium]
MIELTKITQSEIDANGVSSAPTVPNGTAEENKALFDRLTTNVIVPRLNELIDRTQSYIDQRGVKWDGYYIGLLDANGNTNGLMIKYYDDSDGNYKFASCSRTFSCSAPAVGQTVSALLFNKELCPIRSPYPLDSYITVMEFETGAHSAELRITLYPQTGPDNTDEVVHALELYIDSQKAETVYVTESGIIDGEEYDAGWQSLMPEYTQIAGYTLTYLDSSLLNDNSVCLTGDITASYEWTDMVTKKDLDAFSPDPVFATDTVPGMIKVGSGLSIDAYGVLSADDQSYTLPAATANALGGIKVGDGLSINNGVLSTDTHAILPANTAASADTYGRLKANTAKGYERFDICKRKGDPINGYEYYWATLYNDEDLPTASSMTLGGIRVGSGLSIDSGGILSADDRSYTLPAATANALGGIKVGSRLTMTDGVLSADDQSYTLPAATANALGGIKVGSRLTMTDGVLSADDQSYTLPASTANALGGIKIGDGLSIDANGVASAKPDFVYQCTGTADDTAIAALLDTFFASDKTSYRLDIIGDFGVSAHLL